MENIKNTSILIPSQLPEYIRSDESYSKFVAFLTAYYEWMELEYGVTNSTKNLLSYSDIDNTSSEFVQYYINTFLPHFPKDAFFDKRKALKLATELYRSKGTSGSFELFFRMAYNSDVQTTLTESMVFKASDGKWIVPKSIKINSTNPNWLHIKNLRLFGETSKSVATVERSEITGNKTEIYISDIEKLFESGEYIRVVDNRNKDVYFYQGKPYFQQQSRILVLRPNGNRSFIENELIYQGSDISLSFISADFQIPKGSASASVSSWDPSTRQLKVFDINGTFSIGGIVNGVNSESVWVIDDILKNDLDDHIPTFAEILSAKIIGAISSIRIDSNRKYRGSQYKTGDPVIIYGGLNPEVQTPIKAEAEIGEVTRGALEDINVIYSTLGYTIGDSAVKISGDTGAGKQATAKVSLVDQTQVATANGIISDCIIPFLTKKIDSSDYGFVKANTNALSANANTRLYDAFSFISFDTYPVLDIVVTSSDVGYSTVPSVSVESYYRSNYGPGANAIIDTANSASLSSDGYFYSNLKRLGILSPIQIVNAGENYAIGDIINIVGGSGCGAYANVTSVYSSNGGIRTVGFTRDPNSSVQTYPLGGMGFTNKSLPEITVTSDFGVNASLIITSILADRVEVEPVTDRVGSISTFLINNYGEDYISNPNISLRIKDIAVQNVDQSDVIVAGESIYQGTSSALSTFSAFIDSVSRLTDTEDSYKLRIYNYKGILNPNSEILFANSVVSSVTVNTNYSKTIMETGHQYVNGVLTYGDGNARATSKFLNGLIIGDGAYLNEDGQPSSYSVLESDVYNKFTYIVDIEQSIVKYRDALLNLLHPIGTHLIGKNRIYSEHFTPLDYDSSVTKNKVLKYWFDSANSYITVESNIPVEKTNVISVYTESSNSLTDILNIGDRLSFYNNGIWVSSDIKSISNANSTITITDDIRTYYSNTLIGYIEPTSNLAVITEYTERYDILVPNYFTYLNQYTLEEHVPTDISEVLYINDHIVTSAGNTYSIDSVTQNTITGYFEVLLNVSSTLESSGNVDYPETFGFIKTMSNVEPMICKTIY